MDISVPQDRFPAAPPVSADGLTGQEAQRRLAQSGANTMPDTALHPWRRALGKFWVSLLVFCGGVLALDLPLPALQTLSFIAVVFGSQAMIYAIRGRPHLWSLRPSLRLAGSSVVDVAIACGLAIAGIAMAPLPASVVAATRPPPVRSPWRWMWSSGRFSCVLELHEGAPRSRAMTTEICRGG